MHVAVIGPTGFGGSHVCKELLDRGHVVTGLSRTPEKLGKHENYKPVTLDFSQAPIERLVEAFKGADVLVNAYNPPGGPGMYSTSVRSQLIEKIITLLT